MLTSISKPCGRFRSVDVTSEQAQSFKAALNTAPAFLNRFNRSSFARRALQHGPPANPSSGQPASLPQTTGSPPIANAPLSLAAHTAGGFGPNIAQTASQSGQNIAHPLTTSLYVYLCIGQGSSHQYPVLEISSIDTDAKVFASLRRAYLEARKGIRHWLSWWRYRHCEFFQVSRPSSRLGLSSLLANGRLSLRKQR